jgi:predicted peroxiredoxin
MNGYKKMFHKIMEFKLKDSDTYYNHGSTWIILTDKKQWVIELTKEGVLWYNYHFFQSIFTGLMGFEDTAKNQDYITKWVENFIQNGVKETKPEYLEGDLAMEEVIQNGVKHTEPGGYLGSIEMKGKIVHQLESPKQNEEVEYVIENGVKHTVCSSAPFVYGVKDTLQHGVKETFDETHHRRREVVLTIRDGIKETYDDAYHHKSRVDGVIKNGIKQTCAQIPSIQPVVERILEEGILQTKPMDEWVNTNRIVDKVMTESIKETLWMNGDSTNWGLEGDNLLEEHDKVDDTIKNGIKEIIL